MPSGENGRLLFAAFVSVVGGTIIASDRRHLAPSMPLPHEVPSMIVEWSK